MGCAVSAFVLGFLCGTKARSVARAAELPGGLKAPHVRTSHPMPRSRAMTRHAASGLAFMAIACLRVGGRAWVCACAICWRSGLASGVLAWVWVPWEVV